MQVAQSVVQVLANNALKEYGGDLAIGAMTIINSIAMIVPDAYIWTKSRLAAINRI